MNDTSDHDCDDSTDGFDIYADLDHHDQHERHNESAHCHYGESGQNGQNGDDLLLAEVAIMESNLSQSQCDNKELKMQNESLRQTVDKQEKQLAILKANISSLYKTAKAEIERKKREISELRQEYDSLIFKRMIHNNHNNNHSFSKRGDSLAVQKCDKSTNTETYDKKHKSRVCRKESRKYKSSQFHRSRSRSRDTRRKRKNSENESKLNCNKLRKNSVKDLKRESRDRHISRKCDK